MKPQRYLAAAGFGSRRACERLILAGRVTLNNAPLTFNLDIGPGDDVRVDGQPVTVQDNRVYIALNKPVGMISDRGIPTEKSALDLVHMPERLFAVGRLDKDATGLLLLTNDGELAYRLTHPKFEHEKEYRVLVQGHPSAATLRRWREGLLLNNEMTAPAQVSIEVARNEPESAQQSPTAPSHVHDEPTNESWLRIVLHEGRKRQIKRVAKLLGHPVKQLIRVRIGVITLGDLEPGEWRRLTSEEVENLHLEIDAE
jgi:23S rRNA pseudouridine2605 synthase